ncbi:aspartyl/asparaginyl beta-hydroxylase domain-containing protein [Endozoicomonas montiporae]|uniref:Aspartyl/asparaginyl beta-hydroxylase n=1 Tax=Endozoicomonas montiporae CL-33 TaxID=570277 RepID=A0A142BER2_9GAMM|nr:aspartyl/asparaginyl beta-hydroxylase domain-containing protein [Endozoicomonas montiporae]AMO57238.1 aspartyl/asparaginyl beta-hydroxylase [Endozoicomonas montiporae CL-33]
MPELVNDLPFKQLDIGIQNFDRLRQDAINLIQSEEWLDHVNLKDYQGSWQVLPIRGLACHIDAHPVLQAFQISNDDSQLYINYPTAEQLPDVIDLFQNLHCDILSARLMKLAPGACIKTHRDNGLCFSMGQVRLHFCLVSNHNVAFTVAGKPLAIQEGELWYINAHEPHSVVNHSNISRIHLVIDCLSNDWLGDRLGTQCSTR